MFSLLMRLSARTLKLSPSHFPASCSSRASAIVFDDLRRVLLVHHNKIGAGGWPKRMCTWLSSLWVIIRSQASGKPRVESADRNPGPSPQLVIKVDLHDGVQLAGLIDPGSCAA